MISLKKFTQNVVYLLAGISVAESKNTSIPIRYGYILFPGVQALDVFGPLDALNLLQGTHYMNLSLIAKTLDPVATNRLAWSPNAVNSTFGEEFVPTHTFETAPDLDVLIVPGGLGTRAPSPILDSTLAFIKERFPTVQYFLTICTGAGLAARAGVLDGKYATTNKRAWASTTALGPNVKWVPHARWVTDGNVWSSSGVSAGIDQMLAFIGLIYGNNTADMISNGMEYVRHTYSLDDPFAGLYNLSAPANGTIQPGV